MLADKDSEIKVLMERNREAEAEVQALIEQLKRGNKERLGSKSQKGSYLQKQKMRDIPAISTCQVIGVSVLEYLPQNIFQKNH